MFGQLDNIGPNATFELTGDGGEFMYGGKERVRPEATPDDQSADPVSDIEQPLDKFDFWRLFQQYCAIQVTSKHCPLPHLDTSERFENEPAEPGESNCLAANSVRFRLTGSNKRQTVEPLRA
jgi:hypothetical protein